MSKINVLILVDDSFEASVLKECIESYNFNIVKITDNITDAMNTYHSHSIDFIIADVVLNGRPDGITFVKTLLKETPELTTPFIFLTGHTERSVFEATKITKPHGYILKPFNEQEVLYTIELVLEKHNGAKKNCTTLPYFFKKNAVFHKVHPNDISLVEVEGRYCKVSTYENNFIIQYALADFKNQLPVFFLRIHRNYIVNTNKIVEVHSKDNLIVLEKNKYINFGRKYKNAFFENYNINKNN